MALLNLGKSTFNMRSVKVPTNLLHNCISVYGRTKRKHEVVHLGAQLTDPLTNVIQQFDIARTATIAVGLDCTAKFLQTIARDFNEPRTGC